MSKQQRSTKSRTGQPKTWHAGLEKWLTHAFRKRGLDLSRHGILVLLLLLVLIWLMAGAYLVLVSQTMVAARRIQNLRDQLADLQEENGMLERAVVEREAVDKLLWEVRQEGFVPAGQIEFVELGGP